MAAMEAKKSKEKDTKPSGAGAGRGRGAAPKEASRPAPGGGGGHKCMTTSLVLCYFPKITIIVFHSMGSTAGKEFADCSSRSSQETRPIACGCIHFFAQSL